MLRNLNGTALCPSSNLVKSIDSIMYLKSFNTHFSRYWFHSVYFWFALITEAHKPQMRMSRLECNLPYRVLGSVVPKHQNFHHCAKSMECRGVASGNNLAQVKDGKVQDTFMLVWKLWHHKILTKGDNMILAKHLKDGLRTPSSEFWEKISIS